MLNPLAEEILCVNGNCDAEVDQMVLDFILQPGYIELEDNGKTLYFTHGHHLDDAPLPAKKGDVVFYGHTHVPDFSVKDGTVYINPGSVSIPKNGTPHSAIVYENGEIRWLDLESGEFYKISIS